MNPQIVDAKRCAIWSTLIAWYGDSLIDKTFNGVDLHPALVYNGDETQIIIRRGRVGKALSKNGKQPKIAVDDRSESHVSLFAVVSATGLFMHPLFVIHGSPKVYLHDETVAEEVRLFNTEKGYMNKDTFYDMIVNHFIPQVQRKREDLIKLGRDPSKTRAVLVVDGHKSRYDFRTFKALREANIDLVILPAHSSHITQPLDLRLNAIIKNKFTTMWRRKNTSCRRWSESLVRVKASGVDETEKEVEEPPKKKRRRKKKEFKKDPPKKKRGRKRKEPEEESEEDDVVLLEEEGPITISEAEFERFIFLEALTTAVYSISPSTVTKSWEQSHLFPFVPTPPCSKDDQEDLERQADAAGFKKRTRRAINVPPTIPLTGVVNSAEDTRLLDYLEETNITVLPTVTKKKMRSASSSETVIARHDEPDGDVGDYIVKLNSKRRIPSTQYGDSDAIYIIPDEQPTRLRKTKK